MRRTILKRAITGKIDLAVACNFNPTTTYPSVAYRLDDINSAIGIRILIASDLTPYERLAVQWAMTYDVPAVEVMAEVCEDNHQAFMEVYRLILSREPDLIMVEETQKEFPSLLKMANEMGIPIIEVHPARAVNFKQLKSLLGRTPRHAYY